MQNIPDNHVLIEITVDENGKYKEEIVGHGLNSSCGTEDDDLLLKDLLDGLGEEDDWGKTCECHREERVKVVQKPYTSTPFKDTPVNSQEDKKNSLGFGV